MGKVHTIIASDLHLTEIQLYDKKRPLWMSYKLAEHIIDNDFSNMLNYFKENIKGPIELVLNGDTFDFDTVLSLPDDKQVDWLAKLRGLDSEEWMSLFKMDVIIKNHSIWFDSIRDFIKDGHQVVFIVGNHDVELYWESIQKKIYERIEGSEESVRFCNWFYISEQDTYIEHSHQYDPTCVVRNTIDPTIIVHGKSRIRIPFGDLALRYVMNGIGWLNPHSHSDYIKSVKDYAILLLKYLKAQPLMTWTWFWGAMVTFYKSMRDHLKPPITNPLTIDDRIAKVAKRSKSDKNMLIKLMALRAPSACSNPFSIFRELWLDRVFLLFFLLFVALQGILFINLAISVSMFWLWFLVLFAVLLPILIIYSLSIESITTDKCLLTEEIAEYIVKITGVNRIVFSHTHNPEHTYIGSAEYLNSGCWAPTFSETEFVNKINKHTVVLIKPEGKNRTAQLYTWGN